MTLLRLARYTLIWITPLLLSPVHHSMSQELNRKKFNLRRKMKLLHQLTIVIWVIVQWGYVRTFTILYWRNVQYVQYWINDRKLHWFWNAIKFSSKTTVLKSPNSRPTSNRVKYESKVLQYISKHKNVADIRAQVKAVTHLIRVQR